MGGTQAFGSRKLACSAEARQKENPHAWTRAYTHTGTHRHTQAHTSDRARSRKKQPASPRGKRATTKPRPGWSLDLFSAPARREIRSGAKKPTQKLPHTPPARPRRWRIAWRALYTVATNVPGHIPGDQERGGVEERGEVDPHVPVRDRGPVKQSHGFVFQPCKRKRMDTYIRLGRDGGQAGGPGSGNASSAGLAPQ